MNRFWFSAGVHFFLFATTCMLLPKATLPVQLVLGDQTQKVNHLEQKSFSHPHLVQKRKF